MKKYCLRNGKVSFSFYFFHSFFVPDEQQCYFRLTLYGLFRVQIYFPEPLSDSVLDIVGSDSLDCHPRSLSLKCFWSTGFDRALYIWGDAAPFRFDLLGGIFLGIAR